MSAPVRRIGLLFKKRDPRIKAILEESIPWLEARGAEVFVEEDLAEIAPMGSKTCPRDCMPSSVDVITVFGGDGTFLAAARLVAGYGTPILGVNLGSLGFLTEVKRDEVGSAFESLLRGSYVLENRILLEVEVSRKQKRLERYLALNDGVINNGALARIVELEVNVGGQPICTFRADGLIISTPTGSTAYSLSAGGPIVYPTLEAFIITPICPHALTNRPVVVPDREQIDVRLNDGEDVMLTVDGQVGMPLEQGDHLVFRKAVPTIRLVQPVGGTYFKTLREKLKWG